MTKLDMLVENQNLRKMLELMREDIDKNCVDCKKPQPYMVKFKPDCTRCIFGKYRKE